MKKQKENTKQMPRQEKENPLKVYDENNPFIEELEDDDSSYTKMLLGKI